MTNRGGNGAGQGKKIGSSPPPCPAWQEKFSYSIPAPFRKTLIFVFLPSNYYIFLLKKTYFINKNYLKLQINFSHQIKLVFLQKLDNIIEVFNKKISQQKQQIS